MSPDPRESVVLNVRDVTKKYGRRIALDAASFSVDDGEVHGLLGPNGSGKTTCLHLVAGLISPDWGGVTIAGISIVDKVSRAVLGMVPDDLPLPGSLTGREYLRFHDRMRGRDDTASARNLVEAFDLTADLERQICEYSHGMKRKLQVVAATMHHPPLLVLDEPFRGLDPDAAAILRSLIGSYASAGGTVLLATHDMLRAERDCHRVTILHEGVTAAEGEPLQLQEMYSAATLEEVFLAATGSSEGQARRAAALATVLHGESERN